MQTCLCCRHLERVAIDDDLARGEAIRTVAERYGITPSAVARHRGGCIREAIAIAQADERRELGRLVRERLERLIDDGAAAIAEARAAGDRQSLNGAMRELRNALALAARLAGLDRPDPVALTVMQVRDPDAGLLTAERRDRVRELLGFPAAIDVESNDD